MLFELSKRAMITGNTAELDEAIRSKIRPYLYNEGAGKWIHCAHLACLRSPHTSHLTLHFSSSFLIKQEQRSPEIKTIRCYQGRKY